jgi:hypothetical protein
MSARASLYSYQRSWQPLKERQNFRAPKPPAADHIAVAVNSMDLKDMLHEV